MAEASVPVDPFNPGQVFACLGFLESAQLLCGDAEGWFDWRDARNTFTLRAVGGQNPFDIVLKFLNSASVVVLSPFGIDGPWPNHHDPRLSFPSGSDELKTSDKKSFTSAALPVELKGEGAFAGKSIPIDHWLEKKHLQTCKLFAGKQAASQLVQNILTGDKKKEGALGFQDVFKELKSSDFRDPFAVTCPVGGRFGFDARGGWDAMRIGLSLDALAKKQYTRILVEVSPHVEILAAIGLQNTRPEFLSTYQIRYSIWKTHLPLSLCRVAFFSPEKFLPESAFRMFQAHLGDDKQYKKIFFAEEEPSHAYI